MRSRLEKERLLAHLRILFVQTHRVEPDRIEAQGSIVPRNLKLHSRQQNPFFRRTTVQRAAQLTIDIDGGIDDDIGSFLELC